MAGEAKRKCASRKRPNASETPRPVMSFRVNARLWVAIRASAEANGYALSEEIERRLEASLQAETTEAMMRRVLVEDREAQRAALLATLDDQGQIASLRFKRSIPLETSEH